MKDLKWKPQLILTQPWIERRIQNPLKHVRWIFLQKQLTVFNC